jgi:hypothetical protein
MDEEDEHEWQGFLGNQSFQQSKISSLSSSSMVCIPWTDGRGD